MTNSITSFMKTCFKCGECQPRENFYKHSAMEDGHLNKCKKCTKIDSANHRIANLEKVRAYDRERSKNKDRIRLAKQITAAWRAEDKRRAKSHSAVDRAIRSGFLIKEKCCVCGNENSLAHHESYDRPLDVVWYCQIHHKERHKQMVLQGINP